jgi:pyruvate/2-oxoglutarate dehydrogenase complex dihydrolipoamide dehydrogenase (E3) component
MRSDSLFLSTIGLHRNNRPGLRLQISQEYRMKKGEGVYNVVVIGAGTAGLVTAAGTAGLGGRVALIERNLMGGDCLNFGCVPSKALISSARLVERIREAKKWGLDGHQPRFVFERVFGRMRERRARIAPNDSQERFESLGVDVFCGEAHFISPHELEVNGQKLRAKNFVIATGSRAVIPKIEGIENVPYFTNETIFDELKEKPESMIVLGGGPIGCELGQALNRLGVKITIIEYGPQLLGPEDIDVGQFMQKRFEDEGITVQHCTEATRVWMNDGAITLEGNYKPPGATRGSPVQFSGDALLLAAGRCPMMKAVNLEAASVKYTPSGVEVNDYLQTSQPHIYAAGDIANRLKFTHTADHTARVVVRNILVPFQFLRQKVDWSVVPWCTYTDPEVAHVGLGEKEANEKNTDYDLFIVPLVEVDRAVVESEDAGFAKILTAKGSDKILGATIVAPHAGDLLHEFVLAMNAKIGLGRIASMIHAYPTFAELARKAGDKYNKTRLTPRAKKIFTWLYKRARK